MAQFANTLTGFVGTEGGELIVADRLGAIWRLDEGTGSVPTLEPTPILDLTAQVSASPGERGFFNLALTPDGESLIVDYTSADGAITVDSYPYRAGEPIDPGSAQTLFSLRDPYAWHHGGGLAFDRHGNLLVGIGDMEFRQLVPPGPQDPTLMLGGVLRIDAAQVNEPSDATQPTASDMVARGMRNPWRLSVDPSTGDVWIGDVGLDSYEEIDRIDADDLDDGTVTNFGWPYREGPIEQQRGAPDGFDPVEPVLARKHRTGTCGMVAGAWYQGHRIIALRHRYVYGDLCGPALRSFAIDDAGHPVGDRAFADLPETITSIGVDAGGELWVMGAQGGLYRIDPGGSDAEGSDQSPGAQATTTTNQRTEKDCSGGIVQAMLPLSDVSSLDPDELVDAYRSASARVDQVVPTLPEATRSDGELVQRLLHTVLSELDAHPDDRVATLTRLRSELLAGDGPFAGFPAAMARIVDSECG